MFNQVTDNLKTIRIGVYGNTRAGKTSFIYKIIRHWQNKNLIRSLSNEAYDFMRSVDDQIKNSEQVSPTKGITEGISVEVLPDSKSSIKTKYVFSDLLGEMLAGEVDDTETNNNPISQILQCDAYLFFFNPTGLDQNINLDDHFSAEKERALKLISHIRQHRENNYLPIVFVVTHLDKLKTESELLKKTTEWLNEIADGYSKDLESHYKQVKWISNEAFKQANFKTMISSLTEENVEIPIKNINLMLRKNKIVKPIIFLYVVVLFFILFIAVIIASIMFPNGCGTDPSKFDDAKALEHIKTFQGMLIEVVDKSKSIEDKKKIVEKINKEITTWMVPKVNVTNPGLEPKTIDEINKSIKNSQDAITKLIGITEDKKNKCTYLALYIANFSNYNDLNETEKKIADSYWKNYEEYILEEATSIVNRYKGTGVILLKCREEVGNHFKKFENEFSLSKITGGKNKKKLGEQLKITSDYLLMNPQYYNCKLELNSGKFKDPVPPAEIALSVKNINSKKEYLIGLHKNLDPMIGLHTKEKKYDIQLQLIPETTSIEVVFFNEEKRNWENYETLDLVTPESGKKVPLGPLGITLPFKGEDWKCKIDVSGDKINTVITFYLDLENIPEFIKKMGEFDNGNNK